MDVAIERRVAEWVDLFGDPLLFDPAGFRVENLLGQAFGAFPSCTWPDTGAASRRRSRGRGPRG